MKEVLRDLLFGKIPYTEYLKREGFDYTRPRLTINKKAIDKWRDDTNKEDYVLIAAPTEATGYREAKLGELSEYDFFNLYEQGIGMRHSQAPIITSNDYRDEIYKYAIENKASDITLYSYENKIYLMYKIKGITKYHKMTIPKSEFEKVIIAMTGEDVFGFSWSVGLKDGDYVINENWLSRYNLQKLNENDLHLTCRLSQKGKFDKHIEDLNLSEEVAAFLKTSFINLKDKRGIDVGGLRLICGQPSSGKNWTMLAALRLLVEKGIYKAMNIGSPPETVLEGMISVNAQNEELANKASEGLNRQAASFGYLTEITEQNVKSAVISANKGLPIFGTLHTNTAADVVLRLMLITGFSADIILQTLHTVLHQGLVIDDSKPLGMRPVCTYIEFTNELRSKCFGKSTGEIYNILLENTKGDL